MKNLLNQSMKKKNDLPAERPGAGKESGVGANRNQQSAVSSYGVYHFFSAGGRKNQVYPGAVDDV